MEKTICNFRFEAHGFFLNLADQGGEIGVDRETGDIFLDEGMGEDRYDGAVVEPDQFRGLQLVSAPSGEAQIVLTFGDGQKHSLGATRDLSRGRKWVKEATEAIRANKPMTFGAHTAARGAGSLVIRETGPE